MFKRVEKRRKRKEDEEEMGIDEEMKEVLGLQDTDSSESESGSDSDSDSDRSNDEGGASASGMLKRKRVKGSESEGDDSGLADDVVGDEEEEGEDVLESDEDETDHLDSGPQITVAEALQDPLYVVSMDPEIQSCVLCPGKRLKNPAMIRVHMQSQLHARGLKRLEKLSQKASPDDNVVELLARPSESTLVAPNESSKRQAKRKAKQAKLIAKREKQKKLKQKMIARKEHLKADKQAASSAGDTPPPTKNSKTKLLGAEKSKPKPTPTPKPTMKAESALTTSPKDNAVADEPKPKRRKKDASPSDVKPVVTNDPHRRHKNKRYFDESTSTTAVRSLNVPKHSHQRLKEGHGRIKVGKKSHTPLLQVID